MKVKICGISNRDDALLCSRLGADALGFVFYPQSRRYIEPENARSICRELPFFTQKIGVFVNAPAEEVNRIAAEVRLNGVQLHGEEDRHFIAKIKYPAIKALRITPDFDFRQLEEFGDCTILLDAFHPLAPGGTGRSFDWYRIPSKLRDRVILAGGISAENIEEIYRNIAPVAVDLSSSLEARPGKKDPRKVTQFMEIIQHLNRSENAAFCAGTQLERKCET